MGKKGGGWAGSGILECKLTGDTFFNLYYQNVENCLEHNSHAVNNFLCINYKFTYLDFSY